MYQFVIKNRDYILFLCNHLYCVTHIFSQYNIPYSKTENHSHILR